MNEEIDDRTETGNEDLSFGAALLLPVDSLLSTGIHIGTRIKTKEMRPFIYKVRHDGLFVLDIKKTDERIRVAAKFLSRFEPSGIVIVSSRLYGRNPVQKFCELTRATPILGRFPPGIFSNPTHSEYIEANVVMVTDSRADKQAVREASDVGIPVIALCDTDNTFRNIDFIIPTNNKGRKALATAYWLLARQLLIERGELPPKGELPITIDEFETKLAEISPISDGE
jgi:small subunit ribosomal protein S2